MRDMSSVYETELEAISEPSNDLAEDDAILVKNPARMIDKKV